MSIYHTENKGGGVWRKKKFAIGRCFYFPVIFTLTTEIYKNVIYEDAI